MLINSNVKSRLINCYFLFLKKNNKMIDSNYDSINIKLPIKTSKYVSECVKDIFIKCFVDYTKLSGNNISVFCDEKFKKDSQYFKYGFAVKLNIFDKENLCDVKITSEPLIWNMTGFIEHCCKYDIYWLYEKTKDLKDITSFFYGKYSLAQISTAYMCYNNQIFIGEKLNINNFIIKNNTICYEKKQQESEQEKKSFIKVR